MKDVFGCIGLVVSTLVVLVIAAILNGWALATLWLWFVVPLFGLPALTVPYAVGLGLIVNFLTYQDTNNKKEGQEVFDAVITAIAVLVSRPLFAVLFGWVVLQFV